MNLSGNRPVITFEFTLWSEKAKVDIKALLIEHLKWYIEGSFPAAT